MTSPAEKLRRGECPEFNSGPLQGAPPLPTYAPVSAVSEVKSQPVASAQPKQETKLTTIPSKQKEIPKANASVSLAAKQMYLMAAPTSLSLANVAGFGQRITPQEIGPMNVHPQNILGGAIKGWHIGFSRSWRFISDSPDIGVKMGLYPFSEMGIDERTAGINVHELDRDNIDDRFGEFGLKADTGVQILVGRNDDASVHLPLQFGRADADGTFTEIARFDTTNDRMGVGKVPISTLDVDGSLGVKLNGTTTTPTTLTEAHFTMLVDATTGVSTVNLPVASDVLGRIYAIKKIDASANSVVIEPDGAELIDGAANHSLTAQWQGLIIQSDATGWFILADIKAGGASSPHDLLDAGQNQDTVAAGSIKGAIIVGNDGAPSLWDTLPVGTDGQTLTADSTQPLGVKWVTVAPGGGNTLYAPGSFTIQSGHFQFHAKTLELRSTDRATIEGTGRLVLI